MTNYSNTISFTSIKGSAVEANTNKSVKINIHDGQKLNISKINDKYTLSNRKELFDSVRIDSVDNFSKLIVNDDIELDINSIKHSGILYLKDQAKANIKLIEMAAKLNVFDRAKACINEIKGETLNPAKHPLGVLVKLVDNSKLIIEKTCKNAQITLKDNVSMQADKLEHCCLLQTEKSKSKIENIYGKSQVVLKDQSTSEITKAGSDPNDQLGTEIHMQDNTIVEIKENIAEIFQTDSSLSQIFCLKTSLPILQKQARSFINSSSKEISIPSLYKQDDISGLIQKKKQL